MDLAQIAALGGCAVLVFWAVGAHSRLVTLRQEIVKSWAQVDAQVQHRQAMLLPWAEGLRDEPGRARALHDGVVAACAQLQIACDGLRSRPCVGSAAASLRQAEESLLAARARLHAEPPARNGRPGEAATAERLAAADNTLAFARAQFNVAARTYNAAIRQFPTRLVASAFGFQAAGTL